MSTSPSSPDMKKIISDYLQSVRDTLSDDKYHDFFQSMHLFKNNMISFDILAARIQTLFKDHPQLIRGFNAFIPRPHAVEDEKQRVGKFADFIQTLKDRFAHDPRVFSLFTGIMRRCRHEGMSIHEARREVKELIKDHPDLLERFDQVLPGERVAIGYPRRQWYDKLRVIPGDRAAKIGYGNKREQTCDLQPEHNFRDGDLELEGHRKGGQSENYWIEHVNRIKRERKRSRKSEDPGSVKLLQGGKSGEKFKLHDISRSSDSNKNNYKGLYTQEDNSCNKVEEKLPDDIYHKLLELHHMYRKGGESTDALEDKFSDIVAKYPKLMESFSCDLMQCENTEGFLSGFFAKETLRNGRYLDRPIKVSEMQTDRGCYSVDRKRHGDSEKKKGKEKKILDGSCSSFLKHAPSRVTERVDYSKCQRENPSYCFQSRNNSTLIASGRLPSDALVLNDVLVSVPSGRDHTYIKQINQYEETLFRCEDDRYEMDMLLESVKSTAGRVEDFLNKIKDQSIEPDEIEVGKHFNSSNLRCIEVLYDEHGLSVIDMLHKSARLVLPVILTRLKQKIEEFSSCYSALDKVWTEIFSDNYHKSLRHDSLYLKPQDTNDSSEKGSDIKSDDATLADLHGSSEAQKHNDNACMESETNEPSD